MTTTSIVDEYCRYYSDFSKIFSLYVKNFYPKVRFEPEQLLDASYKVWYNLNDEEKISLATFIERILKNESSLNPCEIYSKDKDEKSSRRKKNHKRWKKICHRAKKRFN